MVVLLTNKTFFSIIIKQMEYIKLNKVTKYIVIKIEWIFTPWQLQNIYVYTINCSYKKWRASLLVSDEYLSGCKVSKRVALLDELIWSEYHERYDFSQHCTEKILAVNLCLVKFLQKIMQEIHFFYIVFWWNNVSS